MADHAHTTRRALFAAAPALVLAGAGSASARATLIVSPPVARSDETERRILRWAKAADDLERQANATLPGDDDNYFRLYDAHCRMEDKLLAAPCVSLAVAAAQLRRGALVSMWAGERGDGNDLASLKRIIAYLESRA